jgi:hypothetical protein
MLTATRTLTGALCLTLVAAAGCGGSPTRPSDRSGASVAGTVYMNSGASKSIHAVTGTPASGLVVSIPGTNLSATVESSGYFQIEGVPTGSVRLQFNAASVNATTELSNVRPEELVEIQVEVGGSTATVVADVRSATKVALCHSTGNGSYHLISVSDSAEPAHRNHGDAKVGEPVPGNSPKVFDATCRAVGPSIEIKKSTNGEDADSAPGPRIIVGSPVAWRYVVTNTGTLNLTNVAVVDDRNVTVSCPATTLAVGGSMTCTGAGVATLGQYRNVGTVTAASASGSVTDSDVSHYLGRVPDEAEPGAKIKLCHKTGSGRYQSIEVSVSAEPAHRAHGDGQIGEPVPGQSGKVFGAGCAVN